MAKVVFLIQMLLTFGGRCNRYFWDIRLKILRLPNFNMLFQLVLTKFFKNELFSCLPKVDHLIKSCKSLFFGQRKASFEGHIKLSFKRNSKNSNTRNHTELKIDVRFDKNHLHYNYIDWLNFSIRAQILFNFSWREHAIYWPAGWGFWSKEAKVKWCLLFLLFYSFQSPFSKSRVSVHEIFRKWIIFF